MPADDRAVPLDRLDRLALREASRPDDAPLRVGELARHGACLSDRVLLGDACCRHSTLNHKYLSAILRREAR